MKKVELSNAIAALSRGDVIVYPTDTLYALGADIYNEDAVKKVFKIKRRPRNLPLPIAVSNFKEMEKIAYTNDLVKTVVEQLLPGELTVLLFKKDKVSNAITTGSNKVAVRIPGNDIALDLLSKFGPLTVTSANIHRQKTPYVINDITMQFSKDIQVYLDYGKLDGKPSTIIDLTSKDLVIVRQGSITEKEILDAI
jgi:L-threonylcarbamoyladenylate synthase